MNSVDFYWDEIWQAMDPEIRSKISDKFCGCSNEVFLFQYLKLDKSFEDKFWKITEEWTKK